MKADFYLSAGVRDAGEIAADGVGDEPGSGVSHGDPADDGMVIAPPALAFEEM